MNHQPKLRQWNPASASLVDLGMPAPVRMALLFLMLSLLSFGILLQLIASHEMSWFDQTCFAALDRNRNSMLTRLFIVMTFCGTGSFLIPVYLVITGVYLWRNKKKTAGQIVLVAASSVLLGWILKPLFHRPRPLSPLVPGAGGTSFPSGHALGGFTFSFLCLYLIWKSHLSVLNKWLCTGMTIGFCLLVAGSRVYLHVHFATDVIGSFFIALAWTSGMLLIFSREKQSTVSGSKFATA